MLTILIRHKIKYTFIVLCSLISLAIILHVDRKFEENASINPIPSELLEYECCTPLDHAIRKNIFYLKTHKTGSSTIKMILLRFAQRYSLDVMFVKYNTYWEPFTTNSLVPGTTTPNNKYNILADHTRYSPQLKSYQYPNTKKITTLRHPTTLFESLYKYFSLNVSTGKTFKQFLNDPNKPQIIWGNHNHTSYKGYNQMSIDLGFDWRSNQSETAVDKFIRKIDDEFDFVMITEYMDASLILLANLMGWPLRYIVHLNVNTRPSEKSAYVLTEQDKMVLLQLNRVDARLYYHFLDKFQKCVQQYGTDKLNKQILKLQQMNRQLEEKCVSLQNNDGFLGAINYINKNTSDSECIWATSLVKPYTEELAYKQSNRIKNSKIYT